MAPEVHIWLPIKDLGDLSAHAMSVAVQLEEPSGTERAEACSLASSSCASRHEGFLMFQHRSISTKAQTTSKSDWVLEVVYHDDPIGLEAPVENLGAHFAGGWRVEF